ncbi:MAG TPA: hypothetical protein VFR84_00095 [Candidatus Angelobacter sp.]|nr:hypothetical protein [Candidatus Angelobacter sp.]
MPKTTDAPVPPMQTPRQALIEMILGGSQAINKHLTVEVQQLLAKSRRGAMFTAPFESLKGELGPNVQSFETGQVLLVVNDPKQHQKLEVRVDNDDLSGDEDTLTLSPHVIRENSDQPPEEWEAFLSNFNVNLKRQDGVWRLNKIGVVLEMKVGDADVIKNTFLKDEKPQEASAATAPQDDSKPDPPSMNPQQLISSLFFMELTFAREHPDQGFTCSLPDLTANVSMGQQLQLPGGSYQGYRVSLGGCQGHPAGSFQLVLEPLVQGSGMKAFCSDATRNIRVADDGRGATCLAFGRIAVSNDFEGSQFETPGLSKE